MPTDENIAETLCPLEELPALPSVALKILEKIRDPEAPMYQLAELLAADPPLSAKVLNVVNSSFFGLPRKITNLPHAVNLLGEESLKYIALSFSLIHLFDRKKNLLDYALFWKSSLTCAVVNRTLAVELGREDCEDMYFLGLIHNIGMLVLAQSHPRQYRLVLDKVRRQQVEFHAAENEIFGCSHMQVGAILIEQWGLPETFFLPVRHHHHPVEIAAGNSEDRARARLLSLAFEISRFVNDKDKVMRLAIIEDLLREYGLSGQIRMESVLQKVSGQLEPLLPLFDLDANVGIDYLKLLEESKKEMFNLSFHLSRKIRDQQQSIEDLSVLASQDGLTKLPNYQSFRDTLGQEIEIVQSRMHSSILALADLDTFKAVNDQHGHVAGDRVLQAVAGFLSENIRKSDFVARYGGEEFVFILRNTHPEDGYRILDRLRGELADLAIEYQGAKIFVTMSVGLTSITPEKILPKRQLLRQADSAMYLAKKEGRNRTVIFKSE